MNSRTPILMLLLLLTQTCNAGGQLWYEREDNTNIKVNLYFFWSKHCPHCLESLPFIQNLAEEHPWLAVKSYQLIGNESHIALYEQMAATLDRQARSVPAFLFCNTMETGFDPYTTPAQLRNDLHACYQYLQKHSDLNHYPPATSELPPQLTLPILGDIKPGESSLMSPTLTIAAIDAFNPCAFFVLMFLLSMMMHTASRSRMLIVGMVFVFFSGLLYFLFMAAWLNLFRLIGQLEVITITAGLIAMTIGVINTKDYFHFKKGISLGIPEQAKPRLYQRVRHLLSSKSLPSLLTATVALSFFANLYEFLCTAGFPMVYTRILSFSQLDSLQYYFYLGFYNLVYILPLLTIVLAVTFVFGGKKLQQHQGRILKLISGLMMLALGGVLLLEPNLLNNILFTLGLVCAVIVIATLIVALGKCPHAKPSQ